MPVKYLIKPVGTYKRPLREPWIVHHKKHFCERALFPYVPKISAGDKLAYAAAKFRTICAIVEATSDPFQDVYLPEEADPRDEHRWRYSVRVRPLLIIDDVRSAPRLDDLGYRKWRPRKHKLVNAEEFERIVEAVRRAGGRLPKCD